MKCSEIRKLLPALALGELDAEPARETRRHLEGCPACRGEEAALSAAAAAARGESALAGSAERRERAAAAMGRAHAEESERRLARPRRRWGRGIAAAAGLVLLAGGAAALFRGGTAMELRAARVVGRAEVCRAESGLWSALRPGDVVLPGDRVATLAGGGVRFEMDGGSVTADPDTWISVTPKGRIILERGRLSAEISGPPARSLDIADTGDHGVSVRAGRVEAEVREVRAAVGGHREDRGAPRSVPPAVKEERVRRFFARVTEGQAVLFGSQQQKLLASAGQEGSFDGTGRPALQAVPAAGPVILPMSLTLGLEGGILRWRTEEGEVKTTLGGAEATIRIPATEAGEAPVGAAGEAEIPLRVRVELRK